MFCCGLIPTSSAICPAEFISSHLWTHLIPAHLTPSHPISSLAPSSRLIPSHLVILISSHDSHLISSHAIPGFNIPGLISSHHLMIPISSDDAHAISRHLIASRPIITARPISPHLITSHSLTAPAHSPTRPLTHSLTRSLADLFADSPGG